MPKSVGKNCRVPKPRSHTTCPPNWTKNKRASRQHSFSRLFLACWFLPLCRAKSCDACSVEQGMRSFATAPPSATSVGRRLVGVGGVSGGGRKLQTA